MSTFRTQACARHGHPEISFVFAEPVRVPNLQSILIDYLEGSVERGVRYEVGQRIDLGGSLLRLFDRGDGTLGVRDVGSDGNDVNPESVHRALMRTWCRQEVARSFGLEPTFPSPEGRVTVCSEVHASKHAILLKRLAPTAPDDSGWYVGCTNERHDHDAPTALGAAYLLQLSDQLPWVDQFFALPVGTHLIVLMDERLSVPALWRDEKLVAPLPGSYVAALNSAP